MNQLALLTANTFFLLVVLIVLLVVFSRNGKSRKPSKVREDIKKIKEQINGS